MIIEEKYLEKKFFILLFVKLNVILNIAQFNLNIAKIIYGCKSYILIIIYIIS